MRSGTLSSEPTGLLASFTLAIGVIIIILGVCLLPGAPAAPGPWWVKLLVLVISLLTIGFGGLLAFAIGPKLDDRQRERAWVKRFEERTATSINHQALKRAYKEVRKQNPGYFASYMDAAKIIENRLGFPDDPYSNSSWDLWEAYQRYCK